MKTATKDFYAKRSVRVRCQSGLFGHRNRLRFDYRNYAEFKTYSETFGLAGRLGFASALAAWRANPIIEGSIEPSDFRLVRK
jgi:hypothetical protein